MVFSQGNQYSQAIATAATHDQGMNTRGLMGAPYGNECVASVQTVLKDAGLSQIGGGILGVDAFTSDLLSSGYSKVSQSDASAGDIVNLGGDHVGCLSGGCTTMISDSSSKGTFSWVDSPANENASVGGAYLEFYQHDP